MKNKIKKWQNVRRIHDYFGRRSRRPSRLASAAKPRQKPLKRRKSSSQLNF